MPLYDFSCSECGVTTEVLRKMSDTGPVVCECGKPMNRVYGVPYFAHGKTVKMGFVEDHLKKDADIRKDLSANYGVEKVVPIAMRGGIDAVYRDIKSSGSQVKESMQREKEVGEKKKKAKQKDWMKGAMKRSPVRTREMLDRKAEKAAKDRSISL